MNKVVCIGARKSTLALTQTQLMAEELKQTCPGLEIEAVTKDTLRGRILDKSLQEFGSKSVFVSEFEQTIKTGTIDLAVHSAEDLPMELASGLCIAAVSYHEDPRDILVTMKKAVETEKEIIGVNTSDPRGQLEAMKSRETLWPGLKGVQCSILRGNVHTRLKRPKENSFDGIVLAAVGLKCLDLLGHDGYDFRFLQPNLFIPAGGQGLVAMEAREGSEVAALCQAMDHREGRLCLTLERTVLQLLDADCHEPMGIFSQLSGEKMKVWGISRKNNIARHTYLEGGITPQEIRQMAGQAGKKLG